MKEAFIVDGIRSPIGKFKGALASVRSDDLAAHVLRALMERHPDLPPQAIDDVILGCANQAGEDNRNVARMALLLAGMPWSVPGETVNRLCASGMSAAIHARRAIAAKEGDLFLAGGVEQMTRAPWVVSKVSSAYGRDAEMHDSSFGWRFVNKAMEERFGTESMGQTAENLVDRFNISRQDQDAFAFHSQRKATAARDSGRFAQEITAIGIPRKKQEPLFVDTDEFIKDYTTLEGLAALRPAFRNMEEGGTVTAGNSSGLNDGAAALLIASADALTRYQLTPLARIIASGVAGVEPRIMGIGPVEASRIALKRAGLTLDQMDIIEINEAFAAQVLACTRTLGLEDYDSRINPNGGAIALGHPLGASGARILLTAARELQLSKKKFALVCMCVGVGQGYAVILENSNLPSSITIT